MAPSTPLFWLVGDFGFLGSPCSVPGNHRATPVFPIGEACAGELYSLTLTHLYPRRGPSLVRKAAIFLLDFLGNGPGPRHLPRTPVPYALSAAVSLFTSHILGLRAILDLCSVSCGLDPLAPRLPELSKLGMRAHRKALLKASLTWGPIPRPTKRMMDVLRMGQVSGGSEQPQLGSPSPLPCFSLWLWPQFSLFAVTVRSSLNFETVLSFCFAAFFSQVLFFWGHTTAVACGASAGTQVAHMCQARASPLPCLPFWSLFLLEGSPCCEDCVLCHGSG